MNVATFAADTWDVPSRLFLLGDALVGVVAVVASVFLRRALMRRIDNRHVPVGPLTPAEVGMLFADRRAVMAALAHLRRAGLVDSGCRPARPLTFHDDGLDAFTRNVYDRIVTSGPQNLRALTGSVQFGTLRESLVRRGLMPGRAHQTASWAAAIPIFVVVLVGLARVDAGMKNDKPVLGLIAILVVLGLCAVLVVRTRRRTGLAAEVVRDARQSVSRRSDRIGAGLAVAVGGGAALWAFDPVFAGATGVSATDNGASFWAASTGSGGSSDGGSDSGCGGGSGCGGCGG